MNYAEYWGKNIAAWGESYLDQSHFGEKFDRPEWFSALYRATIGCIEKRLMEQRYRITCEWIDANVKPGMTVADVGCGTGIFSKRVLEKGGAVRCIDISKQALDITRQRLTPHKDSLASYHKMDVQAQAIPKSDCAIVMGVTPYITDPYAAMHNILPMVDSAFILWLDSAAWQNVVREWLPFLNVRNLQCYSAFQADAFYFGYGFKLNSRIKFASGFIDHVRR